MTENGHERENEILELAGNIFLLARDFQLEYKPKEDSHFAYKRKILSNELSFVTSRIRFGVLTQEDMSITEKVAYDFRTYLDFLRGDEYFRKQELEQRKD